jgi:hypothetical protein
VAGDACARQNGEPERQRDPDRDRGSHQRSPESNRRRPRSSLEHGPLIFGGLDRPSRCSQLRFLAHDLSCEALELLARLEAEVIAQGAARPLVDGERFRLATRPVERNHEVGDEALAVRALFDQPTELANELRMASQGEIRFDADLERPRSKLVQSLGLRPAIQAQRNARDDRAAPEAERLFREGRGSGVVTRGGCPGGVVHEGLEDVRVENGWAEVDAIAAASSLEGDAVRRERLAKPRHVCLEAVQCGRRWTVSPDLVDEAIVRYDRARAEQQGRENG